MCRPVWLRWLETAALAGAVPGLTLNVLRRPETVSAKWIPPKWEWVDPLKDRQAQALAEDRGWASRSDSIEAEGFDPEEVDKRIAADRAREKSLGLQFPQAAAKPAAPAPAEAA